MTPEEAFKHSYEAFTYALEHGPSDETRTAACLNSGHAYWYARNIDGKPSDETRVAVCKDIWYASSYAEYIDKVPRDDTWLASGEYQVNYLDDVPGAMKLYFKDWLTRNRHNYKIMKDFCNWESLFTKQHNMIKKLDIDAAVIYVLSIRKVWDENR